MSRKTKLLLLSLVFLVGLAWFARDVLLESLGQYLTTAKSESDSNADYALIPASDYIRSGVNLETIEEAARLQRTGKVKQIAMTCPDMYGVSECGLAEKALRARGYSGTHLEWVRTVPLPDEIEANIAVRWLMARGAKSAFILLPNYKARRLGGVYRRLCAQSTLEVKVLKQSGEFDPRNWWRSRPGQKRFAEEVVRMMRLL